MVNRFVEVFCWIKENVFKQHDKSLKRGEKNFCSDKKDSNLIAY
jgi:hypothetical protein